MIWLLALRGATGARRPITNFLQSDVPCSICKSLSHVAAKFENEKIKKTTIFATLETYCSKLPDKNANTMCGMILRDWFDEISSDENFCGSLPYCRKGNSIGPYDSILQMADTHSIYRPVARPQGILECSLCEMVIGYCLENASNMGSGDALNLMRKDCSAIPEFKDHCDILTDSMISSLLEYIASNLRPSEICTFYSQCS